MKELSNNSKMWEEEATIAFLGQENLIVHPSHILSLLSACKEKQFKNEDLKQRLKEVEKLHNFISLLIQGEK